jgi:hypothetical protein
MLPVIRAYARGAFAHFNPEARQDLIQEVKRFRVCAGRVSQLRRELAKSWRRFVGDEPDSAAA